MTYPFVQRFRKNKVQIAVIYASERNKLHVFEERTSDDDLKVKHNRFRYVIVLFLSETQQDLFGIFLKLRGPETNGHIVEYASFKELYLKRLS